MRQKVAISWSTAADLSFNYLLIDNPRNNWFKSLFLESLARTEILYTRERVDASQRLEQQQRKQQFT